MPRPFKFAVILLALLALLSGCKKKKPPVPQPQEQAPTITTQPQPTLPPPQPPPPQPQPSVTTTPNGAATATKPKPKTRKKGTTAAKKPAPKTETGKKTVVHNGSTTDAAGQLSAGLPPDEATHQRQSAAQLLASTDYTLRGLNRPLSSDEQAMVQQIRSYMQQSHSAEADGDTERAYNLAMKAHLLCDELVKR